MFRRRWAVVGAAAAVFASVLVATSTGGAGAWTRGPLRIAGSDRYATAVELSKTSFPSTAPAVVLASGEAFPDALVGGPLAAKVGGPVLLVGRDTLPDVTAGELTRLAPTAVYVVGGSGVVSDAVFSLVAALLPSAPMQRLWGNDRFETAAAVSALFAPGGSAYVASGEAFPDALAGGASAAAAGRPLLLTRGVALPPPISAELTRLAPTSGVVLGGTAAVSDAAFAQVAAVVPAVRRLFGPDRYATAAAVAADQAPTTQQVVLATGVDYPDALAASPLAGRLRAPLLLSAPTCAPPATLERLQALVWPDVTVVGGGRAVSASAALAAPCVPPTDGEIVPGLRFDTYRLPGPQVMRVLTIDRAQGLDVVSTTALGRLTGRLPTSEIARRTGAIAAVNGDFFLGTGEPVHASVVAGRLLKSPGLVESLVALDAQSGVQLGAPKPTVTLLLEAPQTRITVSRVNGAPPNPGETVLYTSEYTSTITPTVPMCAMYIRPAEKPATTPTGETAQRGVADTVVCGTNPLTTGTYDLAVTRADSATAPSLSALPPGELVTVSWRLQAAWSGVVNAMGANLTLVRNGARTAEVSRTGAFYTEKAPRTSLGVLRDGRLVLVTLDGRQAKYSVGMTVRQFADQLVALGVRDAVNLDGGGSTAMAIRGVLANRPSDAAGERAVGPALLVVNRGYQLPPPATTTTTSTTAPPTTTTTSTTSTTAPPTTTSTTVV